MSVEQLRAARFTALVPGDAKPANFCFARAGGAPSVVAAVDFPYTGGRPGIVAVAYLLHEASPSAMSRALDTCFARLRPLLAGGAEVGARAALEAACRALFPVALADFDRFLVGWRR